MTSTSAKLTQAHYLIDKYPDEEKATKRINKSIRDTGYEVSSLTRGVAHFKNATTKDNIVSLKGTNKYSPKDLASDFKLGVGMQHHNEQFKGRKLQIKNIYKTIPQDEKVSLTGHSLGSSIMTNVMSESKSIRDRTDKAVGFNTGYTSKFHTALSKDLTKEDTKELKQKVTHHHNTDDVISKSLQSNAIGSVSKTKDTDLTSILDRHGLDQFI